MATGRKGEINPSLLAEYGQAAATPLYGFAYGHWPRAAIIELIESMVRGRDLGSTQQSRVAMDVATKTGCAYPWALAEVQRLGSEPTDR